MDHLKLARALAALTTCLASAAALAASVTELDPGQLSAFVRTHPTVAVQLTTSDPRCTDCQGADQAFDDAAAAAPAGLAFVRVRWLEQHRAPDLGPMFEPAGAPHDRSGDLPAHILFQGGAPHQRANGRPTSGALLLAQLRDMAALPADPTPYCVPAVYGNPPPAPVLTTPEGVRQVRLVYRGQFLDLALQECAGRFPVQASRYRAVVAAWKKAHAPALRAGTREVQALSSRADLVRVQCMGTSEFRGLENMATRTDTPDGKGVEADCGRLLKEATALP